MRITTILAASILLLVLACGEEDGEQSRTETTEAAQEDQDGGGTEISEIVETAPQPLYPEGALDPAQVTPETPVSAAALYRAYFIWDGRTVMLQGYPDIPYVDSMMVEDELRLAAAPGDDQELATVSFTETQNVPVTEDMLVTIRGTVDYYWTGELRLIEGSFVENAPPAQPAVETSPYVYSGETPLAVADFYEMFNVWKNREVLVEGYYHSTTTSTTDYGVTVRVDLAEPGDIYTKYVACKMAGGIPEESDSLLVAEREGTRIRGTVTGESFGMVGLEDCVLVNR